MSEHRESNPIQCSETVCQRSFSIRFFRFNHTKLWFDCENFSLPRCFTTFGGLLKTWIHARAFSNSFFTHFALTLLDIMRGYQIFGISPGLPWKVLHAHCEFFVIPKTNCYCIPSDRFYCWCFRFLFNILRHRLSKNDTLFNVETIIRSNLLGPQY